MLYLIQSAIEAYAPAITMIFAAYIIIHTALNAFWRGD